MKSHPVDYGRFSCPGLGQVGTPYPWSHAGFFPMVDFLNQSRATLTQVEKWRAQGWLVTFKDKAGVEYILTASAAEYSRRQERGDFEAFERSGLAWEEDTAFHGSTSTVQIPEALRGFKVKRKTKGGFYCD